MFSICFFFPKAAECLQFFKIRGKLYVEKKINLQVVYTIIMHCKTISVVWCIKKVEFTEL